MNSLYKIFFFIFLMAMLQSCSTYKLIDTSNPEEPEWISKPQKDFFVGLSEIELVHKNDKKFQLAQEKALDDVKSKIASSISTRITSSVSIINKESMLNNLTSISAETDSCINIETNGIPRLTGISLSKIKDSYWEIYKEENLIKLRYYILYHFKEEDIEKYIKEWKDYENKIENLILRINNTEYSKIEDILCDIDSLTSYSTYTSSVMKERINKTIGKLNNIFNSIKVEVVKENLGTIEFSLKYYDKVLQTALPPDITYPKGINIKNIYKDDNHYVVTYDYLYCNIFNKNRIDFCFNYDDKHKFSFSHNIDLSNSSLVKTDNELISPIRISCEKSKTVFFNKKCILYSINLNINSKERGVFRIYKVELQISKLLKNKKTKEIENLIFDNLDFVFKGLGIHTISLMTDEINLKSNNDYLISGTIYYINSFNSIKHNENFRAVETIYFN